MRPHLFTCLLSLTLAAALSAARNEHELCLNVPAGSHAFVIQPK